MPPRKTAPARRPRRELTPLDPAKTKKYARFNRPGSEVWEAASADGVWAYNRIEIPGTPWAVTHIPTGIEAMQHGSLPNARAATADGRALRDVERQQEHKRGEHDERQGGKRNPLCLSC